MGLAPRFLPLSRALTRASCPAALNNGLFTHWQPFDHRTVSPAAFLSPDPGPGAAPGRIGRSSILRAFDTRNDAPQEFPTRSEEHTSELQSLMRNSYAVF